MDCIACGLQLVLETSTGCLISANSLSEGRETGHGHGQSEQTEQAAQVVFREAVSQLVECWEVGGASTSTPWTSSLSTWLSRTGPLLE